MIYLSDFSRVNPEQVTEALCQVADVGPVAGRDPSDCCCVPLRHCGLSLASGVLGRHDDIELRYVVVPVSSLFQECDFCSEVLHVCLRQVCSEFLAEIVHHFFESDTPRLWVWLVVDAFYLLTANFGHRLVDGLDVGGVLGAALLHTGFDHLKRSQKNLILDRIDTPKKRAYT